MIYRTEQAIWAMTHARKARLEKGTERHRAMGILSLAGVRLQGVRLFLL